MRAHLALVVTRKVLEHGHCRRQAVGRQQRLGRDRRNLEERNTNRVVFPINVEQLGRIVSRAKLSFTVTRTPSFIPRGPSGTFFFFVGLATVPLRTSHVVRN